MKRLLAICLSLCLILGLLPTAAFAAPGADGNGLTADNPMPVPADKMVIKNGTYYGISYEWLKGINPDKQTMYFSITLPATVTAVFDDGFRDAWNSQKESNGAATYYSGSRPTDWAPYYVVSIDFSEATSLTTINKQAAMSNGYLSGVLDLSNTKVETIGKNAFKECSGLTGVILPETLKNIGSDNAGSVFYGCTGLEYVRTAGGSPDAVFELPGKLSYLGNQSFYKCTGLPANTTVEIPASVTYMGSEVFHYTPSVTTIVVKADDASEYHGGAFKISGNYGLGNRLTIFNNAAAKNSFTPSGSNTYANSLTYEFTLHYGEEGGTDVRTEPKLYGQAVNVCKAEDGSWAVNADYEIPEAGSANVPIGYAGGWAYNNKLLTTTTVLKPTGDHLYLDVQKILQNPTVEFIVNGEKIETEDTYPELRVSAGSTIGVQVSHPAEDVDVKFEYEWIDVWGDGTEGPRMEEDGFGRYNLWDNPEVTNTITINGTEDERTSSGNYTDEDYGDGYYLLVIYGYSKPKSGGQWTKFYQSANTAIAPDPDRTVNTAYLFDVTIAEPITITPADITVYTGGEGYTGAVDNAGQESTTANGLPEPGYYITLPDWINDQLGGDANAENLSDILKFTYEDGEGRKREWKLELYGTDAHSSDVEGTERQRYIYRMLPGVTEDGEEAPVRLQFKDAAGNATISDEFTPVMEEQYQEYTMSIYSGGLDTSKITASLTLPNGQTVTCGVNSANGKLVVRGLTGEDITTEIIGDEADLSGDGIAALASGTITYYVNGSNVELNDTEGVRLLVDDVLDDGVLADYIQNSMTEIIPAGDYTYAQQYLDLVDTKNGNAYLTTGEDDKLAIYWKVPADFDSTKPFYIVHFDALNRNYSKLEDELSQNPPDLLTTQLVTVNGTQYVKFDTNSFSPFVLVYEKESSGGGGGTHQNYTLRYETNGGEAIQSETHGYSWTKQYEELPVPVRDGYTFDGWYLDSQLTVPVEDDVKVNHSTITLYAGWCKDISDPDITGVSDWLNTSDHNAYLDGYSDGTFGPDNNMTRAEVAQMFYNLLLDKDVPVTVVFSDVPTDAWYAAAVNTLASLGIVNGVGNSQFAPDRPITRAEFTVIAMRFTNGTTEGENIFSDVSENDWFYNQVVGSIQYGWITGYSDGTFQPNKTISRAEVTAIVNRMLDRRADENFVSLHLDDLRLFSDVSRSHWAFYQIVEASNAHNYEKDGDTENWTELR